MDVRRLELLRELSERGSITAVARATQRTASAVSQQLKVLEREAGVPLTERSGRGVILTGAGRALARTATDVAVALERADALWENFKHAPQGEVTLTTFPTAGQMLLPGLLTVVDELPGLTLICSDQDPLLPDFADLTPNFDIVVADSPGTLPSWRERGLAVVPLMQEPMDVGLPEGHRLAKKNTLHASDLVDEVWLGTPDGYPYDRILREIEVTNGSPARIGQRFLDNGIIEALVAAGHGIAVLPRYTTTVGNGLITRPLSGIRATRQISALLRPDRAERPSVRRVVDELRTEAQRVQAEHDATP
ncbi:LysR family transcriptional regulator [Marisediminicola senii]|uniref:LysR family transcriptional regulator n=1 Tax=Marisediminicola senii TaxID=2711233 RepID=UPI0013ED5B11|nr:LysR family transcriptional regulator [Marisediminicola senii]